ncbi:hypothetical protein ACN4EG_27560 [Alkalinema pantanalense CENA528]
MNPRLPSQANGLWLSKSCASLARDFLLLSQADRYSNDTLLGSTAMTFPMETTATCPFAY